MKGMNEWNEWNEYDSSYSYDYGGNVMRISREYEWNMVGHGWQNGDQWEYAGNHPDCMGIWLGSSGTMGTSHGNHMECMEIYWDIWDTMASYLPSN